MPTTLTGPDVRAWPSLSRAARALGVRQVDALAPRRSSWGARGAAGDPPLSGHGHAPGPRVPPARRR